MAGSHGTKAILAAFFANLGIAISKFVAFAFTGSSSMLAESIHSVADTGNQALLLLGGRLSTRDPTGRFAFGFGRERYFWSFIVALVLFSMGSLFALYEGVQKIADPHEIESAAWAFGVLGTAIVLEVFSFRTAIIESLPLKGARTWWEFIRTSRTPELPVVLLEDLGALVGLILALAAVTISVAADAPVWDGIGTLLIGVLLGVIAAILAVEMKGLLIGESARPEEQRLITEAIEGTADVVRLIDLKTQHIGPDEVLVAAKVAFDPSLSVAQLADAVDNVEERVRAVVPAARPMYIEPDLMRTSLHTDDEPPRP